MDKKKKDEEIQEEIVAETIDDEEEMEEVSEEEAEEEEVRESEEDKLKEQVDALSKEVADLKDRLIRNQAETENYKKRLQKEKEDAVKYANTTLVKDLLGPLDDFSRALEAANSTDNFEAMKEGVKMIEDRLYTLLKTNWGLEVIEEADVPFDPNEHEACLLEEKEGIETDTVSLILQKGFKLNGRVIRPAKVKVAKPVTIDD